MDHGPAALFWAAGAGGAPDRAGAGSRGAGGDRFPSGPLLRPSAGKAGGEGPACPPTRRSPGLCPLPETGCERAPGPRSARGYPAAVSTPVGADPAVVGPYLASGPRTTSAGARCDVELIAAGMSNLTYVVTPGGGSRRRRGDPAAPADGRRPGHRARHGPRAPGDLGARADRRAGPADAAPVHRPDVLGAPFYVMERVGRHPRRPASSRRATPTSRRSAARSARRWSTSWPTCTRSTTTPWAWGSSAGRRASPPARSGAGPSSGTPPATATGPGLDALAARLAETVPVTQRSSIVHGDYRLDNCLLDPDGARAASRPSWTGRCRRSATR